jgi:hypothetical protein
MVETAAVVAATTAAAVVVAAIIPTTVAAAAVAETYHGASQEALFLFDESRLYMFPKVSRIME